MKRINDNTVEYTDRERIIVEIHEMLVDQGHSPGMALLIIRGAMLPPPGARSYTPVLDAIFADKDFTSYLAEQVHYSYTDTSHHKCWCENNVVHTPEQAGRLNQRS